MFGAAIGDIVGSRFEFNNLKSTDFELIHPYCHWSDDTICTVAVADWIQKGCKDLVGIMQHWCRRYPNSYGAQFARWIHSDDPQPYASWGNGAAMRVSAVGWSFADLATTLQRAADSAAITHNHPQGIMGAQAIAAAIYLARQGESKNAIRSYLAAHVPHYNLQRCCADIRPDYCFDVSCQGSVPEALVAFLESDSFESALRLAVSLGGDSDTIAAITCSVAEAFYRDIAPFGRAQMQAWLPHDMFTILNNVPTGLNA